LVLNSQIFFDIPFFKRWSPIPLFLSLAWTEWCNSKEKDKWKAILYNFREQIIKDAITSCIFSLVLVSPKKSSCYVIRTFREFWSCPCSKEQTPSSKGHLSGLRLILPGPRLHLQVATWLQPSERSWTTTSYFWVGDCKVIQDNKCLLFSVLEKLLIHQ
jgi:hypothetical protein